MSTPQQFSRWLAGASSEAVDYPALRRLVERYPYFWPAGLLQTFAGDEDAHPETAARLRQLYAVSPARVMAEIAFGGLTPSEEGDFAKTSVSLPESILHSQGEEHNVDEHSSAIAEENIAHGLEHDPLEDAVAHTFGLEEGGAMHNTAVIAPVEELPIAAQPAHHESLVSSEAERVPEPLFTSDYFSHQGVAVDAELPAANSIQSQPPPTSDDDGSDPDRSLMVMRSFADWMQHFQQSSRQAKEEEESKRAVRAMWQKEKLAAALEEEEEEIPEDVFQMAVASIAPDGVVSESLAEVLAAQGKWERATEMYRKLATKEPSKSAYFARKIEALEARHSA